MHPRTGLWVLPALAALAACGRAPEPAAPQAARDVAQPAGWADDLAMPIPQDLNPDPNVLEIDLEARISEVEIIPGFKTPAWTYNGAVPGPMIRAKVGDRLIVHFTNSLPEPTTIHWHGLRVPNDMDGAPGATQEPVPTGGAFRYEFELRDAGTYWYHPHTDSSAQVGRGLYGAILVEDPADPKAFGDDLVLLLSDMGLNEQGELLPADSGGNFGDLFGREGAVLLVNGKVLPTLKVRNGKQQRWRIINATRARYYNIRLRNHRFMRLGGDNGLAARAEDIYNLIVTPGERADAVFTPADAPSTTNVLRWVPTERGYGSTFNRASEQMLKIETVADAPVTPEPIPTQLRTIEPLDVTNAQQRTLNLTIAITSTVEMGINGVPHWNAKPLDIELGATEVWRIVNDTDFSHPFHLHGYFFQVLDDTRVPEWKDTVNVPTKSELTVAVRFDDRPGAWMFHCHILDHADAGMMGHLIVRDPKAPPADAPPAPPAPHHH
ncbi:MAG TPA: multicopper oxidase family protein [Gammaproteobacteria bacterium]|nr:multicopper oxidase family protein [Gammaproteobacteria bacterium]